MRTNPMAELALLALIVFARPTGAQAAPAPPVASGNNTVYVAAPTGEREADRASILAALATVQEGGTIQFAPGTYLVGQIIRVSKPGVTSLGHPNGTTLRGCHPEDFVDPDDYFSCNGLELAGARQTVRGFTFEYTFWAVHLGCCFGERATLTLPDGTSQALPALYRTEGGHLVEGNTFRSAASGVRVNGDWTEPAIVRSNRFLNNWHAVSINGHTVHLLDNDISVPEPHLVPFFGFPWDGIKISPTLPLQGLDEPQTSACVGNVVEGNHVEGHIDGIRIELYFPGTTCRGNVVRNNTIVVRRMRNLRPEGFTLIDPSDSTFVGVPISLLNEPVALERAEPGPGTSIEDNVIEGNRIIGAEGVAIEVLHASRNRIANNTISGVIIRDPFPGNTMGPRGATGADLEWRKANGSGIWISAGSEANEILGNAFEEIASDAVVIEGDRNRVETRSASDAVRDLGRGNRVERSRARDGAFAFTDVAIVDIASGGLVRGQTILLAGNRISNVGPAGSVPIPAGARLVEARGKYLVPGLWDMHAHTVDDRITRETYLPLFLANGVTGIRNMHADCFDPCEDDRTTLAEVRQWQQEIAAGQLIGPRMVAASDVIQGPPPGEPSSVERPATEAEAHALVSLLKERGVDLLKTYDMLPREAYFALADEARKQGIPFAGHVPSAVRASEASDARQRSMEHLVGVFEECSAREDELRPRLVAQFGTPGFGDLALAMAKTFDAAKCDRLYERFARNRTWQVPNLLVWETRERIGDELWQDHPHLRYMPTPEREYWAWRLRRDAEFWTGGLRAVEPKNRLFREMVAAMAHAGVGILAGTDAGMPFVFPGFGLHDELELLVEAGLTPAEALRAATLSAAEYLEATDSLGTVAPGRLADLVLLDANPLDDIRNTQRINAVVFDGRYFDRQALDDVLAGVEAAARRSDTARVAPPTGVRGADRTNILAALEQVRPGGTVQFAPGTSGIGEIVRVDVPRVTLLRHPEGTTLRGCDPDAFSEFQTAVVLEGDSSGVETRGASDTVRDLGSGNRVTGHPTGASFSRATRSVNGDARAVESAIRGYLDAYAAMDPSRLRAHTTDDFLLIENGYTAGLDRVVEGMDPTGSLPFTHYALRDLEIEVDGDIAVYRLVVEWYRGENRADGGIGTGHLRRLDGGWRLARDHMTLLPGRHASSAAALVEYAAEFRGLDSAGTDDRLRLELDGDRLFMTRPDGRPLFGGIRRLELIPDAAGEFHLEFWGGLVEFERGAGGAIETLVYVPPPRMPASYREPLRYARIR